MAEFAVRTDRLRGHASQLSTLERELNAVSVRLGAVQLGGVLQMRTSLTLINSISDCRRAAANQSDNLGKLARGLETLAGLYETCERNLTEPGSRQTGTGSGPSGSAVFDWFDGVINTAFDIGGWAAEMLGEGSGVFRILSGLYDFAGGEISGGIQSMFNAGSQIIRAVFDTTNGGVNADWLDHLLGLNNSGVDDWAEAWSRQLDDMGLGGNTTTGWGTAATVCQWAGYVMSFVSSGFENYDEFDGDMTNARFWGETVLEGVVDVGLGIGAGVAAAALLPATWPAIAVGAAGGFVVWGANEVCEWVTGGDDIGEVVANFVCDRVEDVGDFVEDVGRSIVDGANAVCDWFGSLW